MFDLIEPNLCCSLENNEAVFTSFLRLRSSIDVSANVESIYCTKMQDILLPLDLAKLLEYILDWLATVLSKSIENYLSVEAA